MPGIYSSKISKPSFQPKTIRQIFSTCRLLSVLMLTILLTTGCSLQAFKLNQQVVASSTSASETTPQVTTTVPPTPEPTPVPYDGPPSADHPVIALTFDDGPSLRDTGKLLDLLAEEKVPATFFVLGEQLSSGQQRRDLTLRAFKEGHEIANHGYSHLDLKKAGEKAVRDELSKTSALIEQITGQKPTIMRPPKNLFDDTTKAVCSDLGLSIVSWSWQSCPEDWNHRGEPDVIAQFVIDKAANGHIILLHDTNSTTIEAMPAMIKGLKDKGFRFMTVSQLLSYAGEGEPQPGQVYNQLKVK